MWKTAAIIAELPQVLCKAKASESSVNLDRCTGGDNTGALGEEMAEAGAFRVGAGVRQIGSLVLACPQTGGAGRGRRM